MNEMCLSTDQRLNDLKAYEIDELGQGSFGVVKGNDYVAVKDALIKDFGEKKRFNMEMKALIALGSEFDMTSI